MPETVKASTLEQLLTTTEAANLARVSVAAVSNWRERGYLTRDDERVYLTPARVDGRNRPLYRFLDVAKAEQATRSRAGRRWPR